MRGNRTRIYASRSGTKRMIYTMKLSYLGKRITGTFFFQKICRWLHCCCNGWILLLMYLHSIFVFQVGGNDFLILLPEFKGRQLLCRIHAWFTIISCLCDKPGYSLDLPWSVVDYKTQYLYGGRTKTWPRCNERPHARLKNEIFVTYRTHDSL